MTNDELRKLAEKATPGGWYADEHTHYAEPRKKRWRIMYTATDAHNLGAKFPLASVELYGSGRGGDEANAAFIAAANPRTVISLIDAYERMSRQEQYVVDSGNKRIEVLEKQLAAIAKARDALAEIAEGAIGEDDSLECVREAREQIAELRKVGL